MGHERVGSLPKSQRWNDIVSQMGAVHSSGFPVASVAAQTLQNVRSRYEKLSRDDAVRSIFAFLVSFSRACRSSNPHDELHAAGISIPEESTLLSVVKALRGCVPEHELASEYGQLALAAAADAFGQWHKEHTKTQLPLFQPTPQFFESWQGLGNGAGFCELARIYFGKLTERYLNYFLDRAASTTFPSIPERERFHCEIQAHVDKISKHAFETAKITQSFSAGWFTKHTREGLPDLKEIEGFLAIAFGKLRDELRREEEAK